jgi:esterase/lipase
MSNNVKVEYDSDPYNNHHRMLELFFEYINNYEKYHNNPSEPSKKKCRATLYEIQKQAKELRRDYLEIHETVKQLRLKVYEENKQQREIKKANKGK